MYCIIKYIDYKDYQKEEEDTQEEQAETEAAPAPSNENKTLLINPDCPVGILRDYVSSELQFQDSQAESFELCTEKATLVDTKNAPPTQQGIDILKNNETYYIVFLPAERKERPKVLTPLLCRFTGEYLEFMSQQVRKSSSAKLRRKSSLKGSSTGNSFGSVSGNSKKSTG